MDNLKQLRSDLDALKEVTSMYDKEINNFQVKIHNHLRKGYNIETQILRFLSQFEQKQKK